MIRRTRQNTARAPAPRGEAQSKPSPEAELSLDHPKRVLDLRPDAVFDALDFVDQGVDRFALDELA